MNSQLQFIPNKPGLLFGQTHLAPLLTGWMENPEKIPQAVLLSGPWGNGKTTIARMLASRLATSKGDIREINAAEARGIDDVRAWNDASRFSPFGKASVWILDELHQMTQAAQSALLKTIEQPPRGLYYFLCTTEPSRLLPAIRSRCTPLEVKLLDREAAEDLLQFTTKGQIAPEIREKIFLRSRGHARDLLRLASVALAGGFQDLSQFQNAIGPGVEDVTKILDYLIAGNGITPEHAKWVYQFEDEMALTQVINDSVDRAALTNEKIRGHYSQILAMRVHRKNYLISAQEQLTHLLAALL